MRRRPNVRGRSSQQHYNALSSTHSLRYERNDVINMDPRLTVAAVLTWGRRGDTRAPRHGHRRVALKSERLALRP